VGAGELQLAEHGAGLAEPGAGAGAEPRQHVARGAAVLKRRRGVSRVADAEERLQGAGLVVRRADVLHRGPALACGAVNQGRAVRGVMSQRPEDQAGQTCCMVAFSHEKAVLAATSTRH